MAAPIRSGLQRHLSVRVWNCTLPMHRALLPAGVLLRVHPATQPRVHRVTAALCRQRWVVGADHIALLKILAV